MYTDAELIQLNHPNYDSEHSFREFLRDSFAGEEQYVANAQKNDYIMIPQAMLGYESDRAPTYHYVNGSAEANAYVKRARYPEVCGHAIETAAGKAFSRPPMMENDERLKDVLDTFWGDGSDFRTGCINALTEALAQRAGGIFVNMNDEDEPVMHVYPVESIPNWNTVGKKPNLIVLKDEGPVASAFEHDATEARLVLGLDDDSGKYFIEKWVQQRTGDGALEWFLKDARVTVTMRQNEQTSIPFHPFCPFEDPKRPIFGPLAKTAKSYFQASAEYNHIMWWSATPQPYIRFSMDGNFYGIDEHAAASPEIDGDDGEHRQEIKIKWGSSTPLILREGDIEFAAADAGALAQHEKRLESLRNEMSGLGARAFQNKTNANQTAETERMQQSSEGSLIRLVMKETEKAITAAVRTTALWRGIPAEDFVFMFNPNIQFEPFDLDAVPGLVQLNQDGYISRGHVRNYLRKVEVIGQDESDEEIDEKIEEEGPVGQGFGEFDEFGDSSDLGAGVEEEELDTGGELDEAELEDA